MVQINELVEKYDDEVKKGKEEREAYKERLEKLAKAGHYLPKPVRHWFREFCPKCGNRLSRNKITWVEPIVNLPMYGLIHYTCPCGYEWAKKEYYGGID